MRNGDVPPETIIRTQAAEIDMLRKELERKEKAIAAFKEWQKTAARQRYAYWLAEGARLAESDLPAKYLAILRRLLSRKDRYEAMYRRLMAYCQGMVDTQAKARALSGELLERLADEGAHTV